jgi:hypothetical protein
MVNETTILVAIGAAIVILPMVPWGSLLAKLKKVDNIPEVPTVDDSLHGSVKTLRYYLCLQDKPTRDRGLEACDVLDGIISKQPLLHYSGDE